MDELDNTPKQSDKINLDLAKVLKKITNLKEGEEAIDFSKNISEFKLAL